MTIKKRLRKNKDKITKLAPLLLATSVLVGCAKELPEKEPDSFKEEVRSIESIQTAKVVIKTTGQIGLQKNAIEADSLVSGISALSASKFYNTEIISSTDSVYNELLKDLKLNASEEGQEFEVTFKLTEQFLVAYIQEIGSGKSSLKNDYLPQSSSSLTKRPLFQYKVQAYGIKERIKNSLDEETRNITFKIKDKAASTHFKLSPLTANRMMTGLLGLDSDVAQAIYNKDKIEEDIWSVKRVRSLLRNQEILKESDLYAKYDFKDNEPLKLRVFNNDLYIARVVGKSDLTNDEVKELRNGFISKFITKCDGKLLELVSRLENDCFLRSEFKKSISHVKFIYDRDQEDGSLLARVKIDTSKADHKISKIIKIDTEDSVSVTPLVHQEDKVFALNEFDSASIIVETTTVDSQRKMTREGLEQVESELTPGKSSTIYNTKVVSSTNSKLENLVTALQLNAKENGAKFKITFKRQKDNVVAFIEGVEKNLNELSSELLPSNDKNISKVELFELPITQYGKRVKTGNDPKGGLDNYSFINLNKEDNYTHIELNTSSAARDMGGILSLSDEEVKSLFNKKAFEDKIWTAKELRAALGSDNVLTESEQGNGSKIDDNDLFRAITVDNSLLISRPVKESDLTEKEKKILKNNSFSQYIYKCDEELANKAGINKNECYLRSEFSVAISHARISREKSKYLGETSSKLAITTKDVEAKNSKYIVIADKTKPVAHTARTYKDKEITSLKLSKFKNGEFLMRRVLEDAPNVYNMTFAGSSGSWNVEIVKFEFKNDHVLVKKARPTLQKNGTTEVDEEIIMSFPATYHRVVKYSDSGEKLQFKRYEETDYLDDQAEANINLNHNGVRRIDSAIDFYSGEKCFAGQEPNSSKIENIEQVIDGKDEFLNYSVVSTYFATPSRAYDCAGVYNWNADSHRVLTFKERVSFAKYHGTDEKPQQDIPYELQKKFNYGIFTAEKTVPKGFSEQTNSFDTDVHMPMIFDIRNDKQVEYVLAGIPAPSAELKAANPHKYAVEMDLRKKLILSSQKVIDDLNKGFEKAFKSTGFRTEGLEVIKLKIERDNTMPAGARTITETIGEKSVELEIVDKGHIGDINKNYIYWIQKGTSLSIIGLGGPHYNPRNGYVESASVYLYGGNMKSSVDWMLKTAKAEKKFVKDMKVPKAWQIFKAQAAPAPTDTETETDVTDSGSSTGSAPAGEPEGSGEMKLSPTIFNKQLNKIITKNERAKKYFNNRSSLNLFPFKRNNSVNGFSFQRAHDHVQKLKDNGLDRKHDLSKNELSKIFKLNAKSGKIADISKAFENINNPVAMAKALYGEDSLEARKAELLQKVEWRHGDHTHGKNKNPVCLHSTAEFVLSKLSKIYDIEKKAKTDFGKNDILIDIWMPTLAHEIGHNFGLRHNFIGSFDKKNWIFENEESASRTSSSVMDYTIDDHATYDGLGPYDVYALRAAYAGFVELEGKHAQKVKKQETAGGELKVKNLEHNHPTEGKFYTRLAKIEDIIKATGVENVNNISRSQLREFGIKNIQFCTDEDAGQSPQCNRHDYGTSFKEIADHEIFEYRKLYSYIYFPNDRKQFGTSGPINWLLNKFYKLRMFNEEIWFQYIFNNNATNEAEAAEFQATINDLIGAVDKSLNFFRSIISTPEAPGFVDPVNNPQDRFLPAVVTDVNEETGEKTERLIKVESKWSEGRVFDPQDYRGAVRGSEYDKVAAIIAMTSDRSYSYRYLSHSLRVPYTMIEKFFFGREDTDSYVLQTLEEILQDEVVPRVLDGDKLYDLNPSLYNTKVNEFVRNYAIYGAMFYLNINTYDPSFNPSRSFRVSNVRTNEVDEDTPFISFVKEGRAYVPFASDSLYANRMIERGSVLRDMVLSGLGDTFRLWGSLMEQIEGFFPRIAPAAEFSQEEVDKLRAELPALIEAGDFNGIINIYVGLMGQYFKLYETDQATAQAEVGKLISSWPDDLVTKEFNEKMAEIGLTGVSIGQLRAGITQALESTIVEFESCNMDKSACSPELLTYLQGINPKFHSFYIKSLGRKKLETLKDATFMRDENGQLTGDVDISRPLLSMALSNIDTKYFVQYSGDWNSYRPNKSAVDVYDRIKGNVKELSDIFTMLNPQDNN